jgi:hypothetical protein
MTLPACVEVADNLPGVVAVRDSKAPGGPELVFTPAGRRLSGQPERLRPTRVTPEDAVTAG